jgi:dienelactone hydrolase
MLPTAGLLLVALVPAGSSAARASGAAVAAGAVASAAPAAASRAAQHAEPGLRAGDAVIVPRDWLVLSAVDGRGRRPFRPDAVLAAHVLPGRPPAAGDALAGERGEAAWRAVAADDAGRVEGADGERIAWAYARVDAPEHAVRLARLSGAGTLHVNGCAVAGDLYGHGWGGLPVELAAGANDVYVSGVRGGFALEFEPPPGALAPGAFAHTLPDLVVGEAPAAELGVCVRNASLAWLPAVSIEVLPVGDLPVQRSTYVFEEGLAPLSVRNLAVRIAPEASAPGARIPEDAGDAVELELVISAPGVAPARERIALRVRAPLERRVRTYRSGVDGSVQLYAVVPPAPTAPGAPAAEPGLVLTLHGAGVHAPDQAAAYAPKEGLWIVAPSNRGRFGFDWQDWGRRDAYDALAHALAASGVDRRRVALTGHSMGGHGAWHLAANDPDGFAAVAPSAGWQGFDTYGGRPEGALAELWHRADAPSRTADLAANLAQLPTYVLHGDADETVPAREARDMVALLAAAGGTPALHLEPGAGHWWDGDAAPGADCVDWPPLFALLRASAIPRDPAEVDFTTVDPGVDATHHWVRVLQLAEPGRPGRVRGRLADGRVELATENVRALELVAAARDVRAVEIDGAAVEPASGARLVRAEGTWRAERGAPRGEKRPERMGPLKRGFDRRFVLIVPTGGDRAGDAAALDRARHDAGTWWYRANGDAPIVRDADWLARAALYRGRNAVLYGNADTNRAWAAALGAGAPIDVRRGAVTLRGERYEGDALEALFVLPRRGDADGLVVGLASTGPAADRRASALALFVSGVGYPDYAVVGPKVLAEGDAGVLAAGFFDHAWR